MTTKQIAQELEKQLSSEELAELQSAPPEEKAEPAPEKEVKTTQAGRLLDLVKDKGVKFFLDDRKDCYAVIPVNGHTEIWPLTGEFPSWLNLLYYQATGRPVSNEAVGQAIAVLSSEARLNNPEPVPLSTRVAEHNAAIWYDLTNAAWQAIRINANGWEVHNEPPTLFRRFKHQTAQVIPERGGDMRKILDYVNIKEYKTLFLCWLATCFVPDFPHAMPVFHGEKGAAKSTTCQLLKLLIDPSALETLSLSNDQRTLIVSLQQHWFLPFDNVSFINNDTSDMLCRATTKAGFQQRKLHTNEDDVVFSFMRCLAINGINNVATRPDLLDRALLIELERVTDKERRELREIREAFERDRPSILGGIFDVVSKAMSIYPSVKLESKARLADFERWGYAIGEALGGLGSDFLAEYAANRETQNIEAINADPVATLIVEFMTERDEWEGTVSELYTELTDIAGEHNISTRSKSFPADPTRLSKKLNGIKSNLEAAGISLERERSMYARGLLLKRSKLASLASYCHKPSIHAGLRHDASMTLSGFHDSNAASTVMKKPSVYAGYDANDANDAKNDVFKGELPRKGLI